MKYRYKLIYTLEQEIVFDDEEMREYGIEGEITDKVVKKYLNNLIEDEYGLPFSYTKRKVVKIKD